MANIILTLAGLFFIGHFLQWVFVKTKVPDLLILIIIGFIAGPSVLGIVQQKDVGQVGTVLATVTLIIILYEGGLGLNAKALIKSSLPALFLSILSFVLIAGSSTLALATVFPMSTALLVGLGIGSTSSAIVFPLLKPLDLKEETKTLLSLESAFTDVLAIIIFLAALESVLSKNYSTGSLIFGVGAKPFVSIILGVGFAFSWSFLRKYFISILDMPFSTEAWSLLAYGTIEVLGLNGPIGILAFGFTLANLNLVPKYPFGLIFNLKPVQENEMTLLQSLSFLLKTFFFLYLGMIMQVSSLSVFLWAVLLVALILATRYIAVRVVFSTKKFPLFDALIAFGMGPRGLACAVFSNFASTKRLSRRFIYTKCDLLYNFYFYRGDLTFCDFWKNTINKRPFWGFIQPLS